jgi:hypothetical protein
VALEAQRERARNQALFREVNERIEDLALGGPIEFVCECCDPECTEPLTMRRAEYEAVREHPAYFAVKPGHEVAVVERIVDRQADFWVVEKAADGREVAERLDPRARRSGTP